MKPLLHPDLAELARGLAIADDLSVRLHDRMLVQPGSADGFETRLANALYDEWYVRPGPGTSQASPPGEFLPSLIGANQGADRWDEDWTVDQVLQDHTFEIRKGQRERQVEPGGFVFRNPGSRSREGSRIALFVARDNHELQKNYYYCFGATLDSVSERNDDIRFYFTLDAAEAAPLVRWLTGTLNDFAIPFRFKCLSDPALFYRSDTAVLYVARRFFQIVALLVRNGWHVSPRPRPALTRPIAAGVSAADDPAGRESFGAQRCNMIAAALIRCQPRDATDRENVLSQSFLEAGMDPSRPWLNPGAPDLYAPDFE
jgi:hypothetical protein